MNVGSIEYTCSRCHETGVHVRYDFRRREHWYCEGCWRELRLQMLMDIYDELKARDRYEQTVLGD